MNANLEVNDVPISGHEQHITLRSYRPTFEKRILPIVLYFHGGGFTNGDIEEADPAASQVAERIPAWVVSVGYSLAPEFPFPTAPEDAYIALTWAVSNARHYRADANRIGVAGHDAGGNIAAGLAAIARDRGQFRISAQALLAPLLDPSMTRLADLKEVTPTDLGADECARCYRAYLPQAMQRIHPYAAPIESRRLVGLPPTSIASAEHDLVRADGEKYAVELIAAGVPTEVKRHTGATHQELASHPSVLADVVSFFRRHLGA
jgi:acetyl esterase